jgi:predicted nucleic acid-binding protein
VTFLDTSVVVRYLTEDPPDLAARAATAIDTTVAHTVSTVAIAETAHVLRTGYGLTREEVIDLLLQFVQKTNISVHGLDKTTALAALLLCRPSNRISIPDALIWAEAKQGAPSEVYSFDRRFPSEGITLREP